MLQILLERAEHGRVEEADEEGKTIMHCLSHDDWAKPMQALLEKGANVQALGQNDETQFLALNRGNFACIDPMLTEGYNAHRAHIRN